MKRQQVYIPASDGNLFGWMHLPETQRNCAVIICSPLGVEYTHSHRSIRHLADSMAKSGFSSLRFDYHGVGDSPGNDRDPARVARWKQDILEAIKFARETTGCEKVCLIGIRLGATLAALAACETEIDFLVLWNPAVSGKRYIRELQAVAATSAVEKPKDSSLIEAAGFLMTQETAETLKQIDLLNSKPKVKSKTLIIHRDDFEKDSTLAKALSADELVMPGYVEMMHEPQFTKIPTKALNAIADWLIPQTQSSNRPVNISKSESRSNEQAIQIGSLFGVLNNAGRASADKPLVVLLNSGSVHHVGPNRLYVLLARAFSNQGYPSFRMDLKGLGDSALAGVVKENHPYPDSALADTELALDHLARLGYKSFILLGICSGAHTAFHGAIDIQKHKVVDAIVINPLTFNWVEGMTLETSGALRLQEVAYYKKSMRDPKRWIRLLKGQVNIPYAFGVLIGRIRNLLKKSLSVQPPTPLTIDLKKLYELNRSFTLVVARGDPGYDLLIDGAKSTANQGIKTGKIRVQFIEGGDHTFSTFDPRNELIARLSAHLKAFF